MSGGSHNVKVAAGQANPPEAESPTLFWGSLINREVIHLYPEETLGYVDSNALCGTGHHHRVFERHAAQRVFCTRCLKRARERTEPVAPTVAIVDDEAPTPAPGFVRVVDARVAVAGLPPPPMNSDDWADVRTAVAAFYRGRGRDDLLLRVDTHIEQQASLDFPDGSS